MSTQVGTSSLPARSERISFGGSCGIALLSSSGRPVVHIEVKGWYIATASMYSIKLRDLDGLLTRERAKGHCSAEVPCPFGPPKALNQVTINM